MRRPWVFPTRRPSPTAPEIKSLFHNELRQLLPRTKKVLGRRRIADRGPCFLETLVSNVFYHMHSRPSWAPWRIMLPLESMFPTPE
jgi:hypothetical protein